MVVMLYTSARTSYGCGSLSFAWMRRCITTAVSSDAAALKINRSKFVPRRALLYVPGSSENMLKKASQINVDSLVLELEDGVAMSAKVQARRNVRKYLDDLPIIEAHKCFELGVRINSVSSGLIEDDLKELAKSKHLPQAFMVPKIDSVDDLSGVYNAFQGAYDMERIGNSNCRLVIWIESARGLLNMAEILNAAVNLHKSTNFFKIDAAVFGSDDFCADIGAMRTKNGNETIYARQRFVTCCKAFGIQAIDCVYIDIKDTDGLQMQSRQGMEFGFDGKQSIHPTQIPVIQKAFIPSREKLEWAKQLVHEFDEHEKSGKGAFLFHGHMVDRPLLLQALNIVQLMESIEQ